MTVVVDVTDSIVVVLVVVVPVLVVLRAIWTPGPVDVSVASGRQRGQEHKKSALVV
jgi:hypothetical protein